MRSPSPTIDELLDDFPYTRRQAAAALNVSQSSIKQAVGRGQLREYHLVGGYRYLGKDLKAYFFSCLVNPVGRREEKLPSRQPQEVPIKHLDAARLLAAWSREG
jgi:hypothetical protein